jgi:hypothetical protein
VAAGVVRLEGGGAVVMVDDHVQRVRVGPDGRLSCTCLWWAKYRGGRGPCKHALAVSLCSNQGSVAGGRAEDGAGSTVVEEMR